MLSWINVKNLNPTNKNLIVVQLNICSLLVHQSELIHLLATLEQKNSKIDILLLCETFLTSKTASLVNIPGYKLMFRSHQFNKGSGTAILVKEDINFTRRNDLEIFNEGLVESTYVEIRTRSNNNMIVGSLYRPPNTTEKNLCEHINEIIPKIQAETGNKQIILGMDHNLDLLKSNNPCCHPWLYYPSLP